METYQDDPVQWWSTSSLTEKPGSWQPLFPSPLVLLRKLCLPVFFFFYSTTLSGGFYIFSVSISNYGGQNYKCWAINAPQYALGLVIVNILSNILYLLNKNCMLVCYILGTEHSVCLLVQIRQCGRCCYNKNIHMQFGKISWEKGIIFIHKACQHF